MKLTRELRNTYIQRIKDEFKELTGIEIDDGFFIKSLKVCSHIHLKFDYHNGSTDKDQYFVVYYKDEYGLVRHKYCFCEEYTPLRLIYFSPYFLINKEHFDTFKKIKYEQVKIKALEEWNELIDRKLLYKKKIKDAKIRENKMQMEFDETIDLRTITSLYPNYFVKFHKTKVTLHNYADPTHYYRRPAYTIKIKPIDLGIYGMKIYYKKEFDDAISKIDIT